MEEEALDLCRSMVESAANECASNGGGKGGSAVGAELLAQCSSRVCCWTRDHHRLLAVLVSMEEVALCPCRFVVGNYLKSHI